MTERSPAMDDDLSPADGGVRPTSAIRLDRIEAVVNAASGSVGPGAAEALRSIVETFGLSVNVAAVAPDQLAQALARAVAARPDLLIVLAGDGTARLAAELCGPDGPVLAPLPGGTMNMLPRALYGERDWKAALAAALAAGEIQPVSGGEVAGRRFYVAAILGAPALWADAREAIRSGKLGLAMLRARRAMMRAFRGRLAFDLGDGRLRKAEALTLMCPLVSRALTTEQALEAAALDPRGVADAFRLGLRAAFGGQFGEWREDPVVTTELTLKGRAWAGGRIPAILDGESCRFPRMVSFAFKAAAFRALAPPQEPGAA